jgi:hypothetical protein
MAVVSSAYERAAPASSNAFGMTPTRRIAFVAGVLFGVAQQGGTMQAVATVPEFAWELSLGIYLAVHGFRGSPILPTGRPDEVVIGREAAAMAVAT